MRTLKLQVQTSLDGFVAGPGGEMDFLTWSWDDALKRYVTELTAPVDGILLGRRLAEGFIPHWAAVAADPANPEHEAGRKFTDTPKVVFSRTLAESPWPTTRVARDLVEEVERLKRAPGGDLIAYGGATFVASLVRHGLVDEYHLFVNPTAIGKGLSIFAELEAKRELTLAGATAFECGIVVLRYVPRREAASTDAWPWPDELDALVAAPAHHRLLFENAHVRVLDTRIGPGERTPVHTHRWPATHCVLSWSDFVRRDADERVTADSRTRTPGAVPPMALWGDALGPHSLENVGTAPLHVISTEVKSAAPRAR